MIGSGRRQAAGSSIVEGAVGLLLLIIVGISCMLLITAGGAAAYYKYKLGCVTDRAALCIAFQLYPLGADNKYFSAASSSLNANTQTLVNRLLDDIGLPDTSHGASVSASMITGSSSGRQILFVTVNEPSLPLIRSPGGGVLSIAMQDSTALPVPLHLPPSVLQINAGSTSLVVPGFGVSTTPPCAAPTTFQLTP